MADDDLDLNLLFWDDDEAYYRSREGLPRQPLSLGEYFILVFLVMGGSIFLAFGSEISRQSDLTEGEYSALALSIAFIGLITVCFVRREIGKAGKGRPMKEYHRDEPWGSLPQVVGNLARPTNGPMRICESALNGKDTALPPVDFAFSGEGHMLGNLATPVTGPHEVGEGTRTNNAEVAQSQLNVSESEPVTKIHFRLADGTRLMANFNHGHKVRDLHYFLNAARPESVPLDYSLTLFPNRELTDQESSIEDAGVLSTTLFLRVK